MSPQAVASYVVHAPRQVGMITDVSLMISINFHRNKSFFVHLIGYHSRHTFSCVLPSLVTTVAQQLRNELRMRGPTLSRDLRPRGVSPATFTRAIATIRHELLAVGATRSLALAFRRTIPGAPATLPIYEVLPGEVRHFGTLHPIEPGGFYVESHFPVAGFYPDLPWFFHDLRPSGFLGRLAPRRHPELALPPDIQLWSADHVLRWLQDWGVDTVGSFVIGDPAFGKLHQHEASAAVRDDERSQRYPALANEVLALGVPGSSAAGEQPKFLATRTGDDSSTPVLVKFSPPVVDDGARRTADLLRCEHHALATLRRAGIPAASTTVLDADGRVFLEVERFDRRAGGRLGLVSLLATAANEGCDLQTWSAAANGLLDARVIGPEDHERIYWLDRFGELIGNSDRHVGNLSLFYADGRVGRVAPVYDMLPMRYAVRNGEFTTPALWPRTPNPRYPTAWRQAWAAATAFWAIVADDPAIHEELRAVAAENGRRLREARELLDRLPR